MKPNFDENKLLPAIVQDARTRAVLMLAWMNADAWRLTRATREAHFWSRQRRALWKKGETSGNVQSVREIRLDCDNDAVLLSVDPAGPACHTGATSCFFNLVGDPAAPAETDWRDLERVIRERRDHPRADSYTARLFAQGIEEIAKKVGEEGVEVALAARQSDERLIAEVADLFYHTLVLLAARGLTFEQIEKELAKRQR
ncbi:MAG: bifunctional phosphoribosyl-AMP cyclohydrolase/phosphoribosyl-ATP diphosphatase HisIE [Chloroflexi bacterium]|nr:bifunctional phosphoribosyl-AMP cyclohydrolase/phosphoribosyl-ATP diphosphatase HisIE [Chloroflexota bacterium]